MRWPASTTAAARFRFGGEVMYSLVPNTIGFGGVSEIYGEDDIGGLSAVLRISFVH